MEILEKHVPGIAKNPMIGFADGMTIRSLLQMPQAKQYGVTIDFKLKSTNNKRPSALTDGLLFSSFKSNGNALLVPFIQIACAAHTDHTVGQRRERLELMAQTADQRAQDLRGFPLGSIISLDQ